MKSEVNLEQFEVLILEDGNFRAKTRQAPP